MPCEKKSLKKEEAPQVNNSLALKIYSSHSSQHEIFVGGGVSAGSCHSAAKNSPTKSNTVKHLVTHISCISEVYTACHPRSEFPLRGPWPVSSPLPGHTGASLQLTGPRVCSCCWQPPPPAQLSSSSSAFPEGPSRPPHMETVSHSPLGTASPPVCSPGPCPSPVSSL